MGAPALFDALAEAAVLRVRRFKPQNLSNTAWAYATANHEAPALFDAVAKAAVPRLGEFKPQELSNTAWAYAVFGVPAECLFGISSPFAELCAAQTKKFQTRELRQFHQWLLWREEQGVDSALPLELRKRCFSAFTEEEGKPSKMQKETMAVLASLDEVVGVEEEVRNNSGYSLDAVVTLRSGQKVSVEVDGPWHFIGRSRQPNGSTRIKRRQLVSLDDSPLVSVPYWEVDNNKSKSARAAYLELELRLALEEETDA